MSYIFFEITHLNYSSPSSNKESLCISQTIKVSNHLLINYIKVPYQLQFMRISIKADQFHQFSTILKPFARFYRKQTSL